MLDTLNNSPADAFEHEIQQVLNVDGALWYIALCNLFANLDSYLGSGHNFYMYAEDDGFFHIIPWDLNESFGAFNQNLSIDQIERLSPFYQQQNASRPLVGRLLDEFDDWIELLNISDREVDLSGMYLTDRKDDLRKWAFPEGTMLAPGAYLIVWADEDGSDAQGLHTSFKLSSEGETVLLVDTDGWGNAILDSVTFGVQEPDIAFGRSPDGTGRFEKLLSPTPMGSNRTTTAFLPEFPCMIAYCGELSRSRVFFFEEV